MHIIYKEKDDLYQFITCNTGQGLLYHPSKAFNNKNTMYPTIKYQTSIKIYIIMKKLLIQFWNIYFSLWLNLNQI